MGKVTAYKAQDGTLFDDEGDQIAHDDTQVLNAEVKELAEAAMSCANYVDDWGTTVISTTEEMEAAILHVLGTKPATASNVMRLLKSLREHAQSKKESAQ